MRLTQNHMGGWFGGELGRFSKSKSHSVPIWWWIHEGGQVPNRLTSWFQGELLRSSASSLAWVSYFGVNYKGRSSTQLHGSFIYYRLSHKIDHVSYFTSNSLSKLILKCLHLQFGHEFTTWAESKMIELPILD